MKRNWFLNLCRDTGLMIHQVASPGPAGGNDKSGTTRKHKLSETREETQLNDSVTLRRTTVEEVEIKRP